MAVKRKQPAKKRTPAKRMKRTAKKAAAAAPVAQAFHTPMPGGMRERARIVWSQLAPIMEQYGRLDDNTAPSFAYLCNQIADYDWVCERVAALGDDIVLFNTNGTQSMHPLEKIRQSRSREYAAALKEWGLTPASLGRLGVTGMPLKERDEHAAFEAL